MTKAGRRENWRGPRRALSLDEQLELQRAMARARLDRRSSRTARELAVRYGVSARTIWRYVEAIPTPVGMENLRMRLNEWASERDIQLTTDDMLTLLYVIRRHRDGLLERAA